MQLLNVFLANFATPPDGQSGHMNMYVMTQTTPKRDGSMENMIVTHEFGHGVSNRLTGGPANTDCLPSGESGGMGEGWSDALAYIIETRPGDNRKTKNAPGAWSFNLPNGIRKYPYTSDKTISPAMYGDTSASGEVHAVGAVWAQILWEPYWNLVDKLGYASDLKADYKSGKGNAVFVSNRLLT